MKLRKIRELKWQKEKAEGVHLMCGKQEVGYIFPSADGHNWTGFLNALYHKQDYPNLKDAAADIERRWNEFLNRISDEIETN